MKELVLNATPVRTCNNYLINDIVLYETDISKNISEFKNVTFEQFDESIEISKDTSNIELSYGNGRELEKQFINANSRIKLVINSSTKAQNIINFIFDEKNRNLVDVIEIVAKENVKASIVIRYAINKLNDFSNSYIEEAKFEKGYHNGVITVLAKENAKVSVTVENLLGKNTNNFISMENLVEANAELTYNYIDFGGNNRVINSYTNLKGDKSKNRFNSIYLGEGKQKLDYNYIANLYGKESDVNIEVQGAIKDTVHKNFKGTIDFKTGGKKAKGAENEFCTLLSDDARAISLPMLLCSEEDVEGAHSTAAGKPDKDELFYLQTRGFTEKEAEKLLVKANFNEIIENLKSEELKQEIIAEIENRLN